MLALLLAAPSAGSGPVASLSRLSVPSPEPPQEQANEPSVPHLTDSVQLLPVRVEWPGYGAYTVPGLYSTRRVTHDVDLGRTVAMELAIAEPMLAQNSVGSSTTAPRIALTFDDGPSATYTPQLLDIFAQNSARCTFFVLGGLVSKHKQLIQRMEEEGHEVAIHSWWHANYTGLSDGAIASDLARCQRTLDPLVNRPVRWTRPPYGAVNSRVRNAITSAGYRVAMWTIDPRDWQNPGASAVVSRILKQAKNGSIVVMHDGGGNRAGTVAAMRILLPRLRERGFQIVTMSELHGLSEPPPAENGMILTIADERYRIEADFQDVRVMVDGNPVELAEPPVMVRDQFLVPARPVLRALGTDADWNPQELSVSFDGVRGRFTVKLNSLDVSLDDQELFVQVPSIYYHGTAMLPVWLMANACGATVQFDPATRTIEYTGRVQTDVRSRQAEGLMTLRTLDGVLVCDWMQGLCARPRSRGSSGPRTI